MTCRPVSLSLNSAARPSCRITANRALVQFLGSFYNLVLKFTSAGQHAPDACANEAKTIGGLMGFVM